ncbi:uncharacterized protein [Nicotiana tomentosiformis]|uniref:uncharacterized protein isoform X2 n=1 Tax=Nicotiana tomentosiformis TaxID=4098 RepID=UPI00388C3A1E
MGVARSNTNATNRAKLKMLHHMGQKRWQSTDLATIIFETRKKNNKLAEPEAIEKHALIEEIVQLDPSLPSIKIVEKYCGPQTRSHVFGFGGRVKAKDLKCGIS